MTLTVEQVVGAYIKLRKKRDEIAAEAKAKTADVAEKMVKLEAWLMQKAEEDGVSSFKTAAGTAFISTTDYANVENWDAVLEFIRDNEAFDLLEKRVNKTAVKGYMETRNAPVPGVTYGTKVGINVRKAAGGDGE